MSGFVDFLISYSALSNIVRNTHVFVWFDFILILLIDNINLIAFLRRKKRIEMNEENLKIILVNGFLRANLV